MAIFAPNTAPFVVFMIGRAHNGHHIECKPYYKANIWFWVQLIPIIFFSGICVLLGKLPSEANYRLTKIVEACYALAWLTFVTCFCALFTLWIAIVSEEWWWPYNCFFPPLPDVCWTGLEAWNSTGLYLAIGYSLLGYIVLRIAVLIGDSD